MEEERIKVLSFPSDSPPLSIIAAAKIAGIALPTQTSTSGSPTLSFSNRYFFLAYFLVLISILGLGFY